MVLSGFSIQMKKKIAEIFAEKLKKQRLEAGLRQSDLAKNCGLSKNYIGELERAEKNITLEKVFLLSKILGCSVSTLIPNEEEIE